MSDGEKDLIAMVDGNIEQRNKRTLDSEIVSIIFETDSIILCRQLLDFGGKSLLFHVRKVPSS